MSEKNNTTGSNSSAEHRSTENVSNMTDDTNRSTSNVGRNNTPIVAGHNNVESTADHASTNERSTAQNISPANSSNMDTNGAVWIPGSSNIPSGDHIDRFDEEDISVHSAEEPVPLHQHTGELGNEYPQIYNASPTSSSQTSLYRQNSRTSLASRTSRQRSSARNGLLENKNEKLPNLDVYDGPNLYEPDTRDRTFGDLEEEFPGFNVRLSTNEKPLNWPTSKKFFHTIMYGLTTLTAQFGATALSPNAAMMKDKFHVSREVTVLTFSIYVMGQALGPMLFAPLSEVAGRKIGVFVPCLVAGLFLISAGCVQNIWALMVIRFISGVFSAAPIVSSGGALGDMWEASQRASALALYSVAIILGTSSATVFGSLLHTTGSYGWRWTLWLSGLMQVTMPAINLIFLSESFVPVLERQKAKKLRLKTGVWALHADLDAWRLTPVEFLKVHCMRPILMFITPIMFVLVMYAAFSYGLMFFAVTNVGEEFQKYHGFSPVRSYCTLFAFFIGFSCGLVCNIAFSRRYLAVAKRNGGKAPPEERLWSMMLLGWTLFGGMFLYGWTMRPDLHWIIPCVGLLLLGMGLAVIFQGTLVYIVDCYTKFAASGIAASTFVRSIFGGVFPLFSLQMYSKLGPGWASSLLGFVGIALWPFCFVFYFYGARLRRINPYEKLLT